MRPDEHDKTRYIPVCLRDIPLEIRLYHARRLVDRTWGARERRQLLTAALCPSDTIYWVRP